MADDPRYFQPKPPVSAPRPVCESHHADSVVGGEGHLRGEAGEQPALLYDEMAPDLTPVEREADTGKVRVGPVC